MDGVIEYNKDGEAIGEWVLTVQQTYLGSDDLSQPIYRSDVVYSFKMYRFPHLRFDNVSDN